MLDWTQAVVRWTGGEAPVGIGVVRNLGYGGSDEKGEPGFGAPGGDG